MIDLDLLLQQPCAAGLFCCPDSMHSSRLPSWCAKQDTSSTQHDYFTSCALNAACVCCLFCLIGCFCRLDALLFTACLLAVLLVLPAGVRNSVGFDWHPKTGELYFTVSARVILITAASSDVTCLLHYTLTTVGAGWRPLRSAH